MTPEEILNKNIVWDIFSNRYRETSKHILTAIEEYGKQEWNEAIKLAAEEAQLGHRLELWDDPKEGDEAWAKIPIINKESILKLLK